MKTTRRGALLVDGSNFITSIERRGPGRAPGRVDFNALVAALESRLPGVRLGLRHYYGSYRTPEQLAVRKDFFDALRRRGWGVYELQAKHYSDGRWKEKQVDLAIALDAYKLALLGHVEVLVLVTHDADFLALINRLPASVKAVVVGWDDEMSLELRRANAEFIKLDEIWHDVLYV